MSTNTLTTRVAAEVRAEMARKRITGRALAQQVGKPVSTVARWTRGDGALDLEALDIIAGAIDVNASELVRRAFTGSSPSGPADQPTVPYVHGPLLELLTSIRTDQDYSPERVAA